MSSFALLPDVHPLSSPTDSAHLQNIERTPLHASPTIGTLAVALVSATVALLVPPIAPYHLKNILITPGQVTSIMNPVGTPVTMTAVWPSRTSAWVARLLDLCICGHEEEALKEISLATTDFKSSGKFQQLTDDLMQLSSAKLPDIVLVGLLRNTYSVRAHIPTWGSLLDQTEKTLTNHKKNPRALLRGLKGH